MEEIIYDIESGEEKEPEAAVGMATTHEEPEAADAESASAEAVRITDPHKEIERMVEEMGAETLLSILKDNRNAAIRQIISEIEAARQGFIPSGTSMARECSSIFDLAALA